MVRQATHLTRTAQLLPYIVYSRFTVARCRLKGAPGYHSVLGYNKDHVNYQPPIVPFVSQIVGAGVFVSTGVAATELAGCVLCRCARRMRRGGCAAWLPWMTCMLQSLSLNHHAAHIASLLH